MLFVTSSGGGISESQFSNAGSPRRKGPAPGSFWGDWIGGNSTQSGPHNQSTNPNLRMGM